MDTETMDIINVDPSLLSMRKPKVDRDQPASSFAKTRYSPDSLRLHVYMYDVHVLKQTFSEDRAFVYFKAAPDILKKVAAIDDWFVQTIIRNRLEFFSNARPLEENTLEDYFARSVIVSANGTVIKMRVKMDRMPDPVPAGRHSFMLYLRGVRFFKNHCYTEWEMLKCQVAMPPFLKLEDDAADAVDAVDAVESVDAVDSVDAVEGKREVRRDVRETRVVRGGDNGYVNGYASDDEIAPDPEWLHDITEELSERAIKYRDMYQSKLRLAEGYVAQLAECSKDRRSDVACINAIAETLQELPCT
jgi:hypothetical protein